MGLQGTFPGCRLCLSDTLRHHQISVGMGGLRHKFPGAAPRFGISRQLEFAPAAPPDQGVGPLRPVSLLQRLEIRKDF